MILITNGKVITRDGDRPYFADGAVLVDGRYIKAVGPRVELEKAYPDAQRVDAKGGVIMPAFINVHSHIYSALARGLSIKGFNPTNFYEILDGMWWAIDRNLTLEGTRASAYTTIIDGIKTGCTTIFDHHASYKAISGSSSRSRRWPRTWASGPASATRCPSGTGRRSVTRPSRRTPTSSLTAKRTPIP